MRSTDQDRLSIGTLRIHSANDRYQPGPALTCPVVALTGDNDRRVSLDQARAWSDVADTAFDLRVSGGGHFFLGEHTAEVADVVRGVLGC